MKRVVALSAVVIVFGAVAGGGTPATYQSTETVTLASAKLTATWKESWLTAKLRFAGTVDAPSKLTAVLRPVSRAGPPAAASKISVSGPGSFAGTLELPARVLPGLYRLSVGGTSNGHRLEPAEREVTLPAPPEGIVDKSFASATKGGPPVTTLPSPRTEVHARFYFVVPPRSKVVHVAWHSPSFRWLGQVKKPYKPTFDTFIRTSTQLERGVWFCVLSSGGRVVKRVRVRIA